MKPIAMLLLMTALGTAQEVKIQPLSLTVSNSALGASRDVGIWIVSVVLPPGTSRTRAEILMPLPSAVQAIPNRQAEILLTRKAYQDPRSMLARIAASLVDVAPMVLTAAGVVTGSPGYSWAGVGTGSLSHLVPVLRSRAPDASIISASDLLPDVISASGQWYIVSSLVQDAKPVGPVRIP